MMKKTAVILMMLCLSGCFASTPQSRFYLLETQAAAFAVSKAKITVALENIRIPAYVSRPQIVWQKPDSPELKIAEFDRWGSDLADMMQNVLIEDLQNLLPKGEVYPLVYGKNPQRIVKISVEKMSGWPDEKAWLQGRFQILNLQGKILHEQTFGFETDCQKTYASYVSAQSRLLADLAGEIARTLTKNNRT